MGDNKFDFRIDQPTYVQALEVYRQMEQLLVTEREKISLDIAGTEKSWAGTAADAVRTGMTHFLEDGDYAEAYRKVREMRILMEETLPEINALLALCEGFAGQFKSDDYVEPLRPACGDNTVRCGGVLALDYDMVPRITDACDHVIQENNALTDKLSDIMDSCRDLIDGTDSDLEALRAASAKINRVSNYRKAFKTYADGIRALENDMVTRLRAIAGDTGEAAPAGIKGTKTYEGKNLHAGINADVKTGIKAGRGKEIKGKSLREAGRAAYDEETEKICTLVNRYALNGDTQGLCRFTECVMSEDCVVRTTGNGEELIYTVDFDTATLKRLLDTAERNGEYAAYGYIRSLYGAGGITLHAGEKESCSYMITAGENGIVIHAQTDRDAQNMITEYDAIGKVLFDEADRVLGDISEGKQVPWEEIKNLYESIGKYSIIQRTADRDRSKAYNYKQKLTDTYTDARKKELEKLEERYFSHGELEVLFGDIPYTVQVRGSHDYRPLTDEEIKQWNRRKELYSSWIPYWEELGIDMTEMEMYYYGTAADKCIENTKARAKKSPVEYSLFSLLLEKTGAVTKSVSAFASYLTGETIKEESAWTMPDRMSEAIRETVAGSPEGSGDLYAEAKRRAYDTAMKVADVAVYILSGHPAAMMGLEAYGDGAYEAAGDGAGSLGIQARGILDAAAEIMTVRIFSGMKKAESIPELVLASVDTAKDAAAVNSIHSMADFLISGENSSIGERYKGYIEEGDTEKEAIEKTICDVKTEFCEDLVMSAAVSAVIGLLGNKELLKKSSKSGKTTGKLWDYSKQFDGELANFNDGYIIKDVVDKDMYLVQFHSDAEVGSGRSLKYWTTFDEANGISTIDDYMDKMALMSNWGARDNVSIAKIPAGTKIKYAIGTAKEQVGAIESRPGGGLQILFEQFDDSWVIETRTLP